MGFIIGFNLLSIWTFGAIYAVPLARYQQSNHNLYDTVNNQYDITTPKHINDLDANHVERAMTDVTSTLKEVEKILESDPSLPRLTRGEIEELFENVTKEEYEKSLQIGDMKRAKHMRALMLVLPYNTNNYSQDHLQVKYENYSIHLAPSIIICIPNFLDLLDHCNISDILFLIQNSNIPLLSLFYVSIECVISTFNLYFLKQIECIHTK